MSKALLKRLPIDLLALLIVCVGSSAVAQSNQVSPSAEPVRIKSGVKLMLDLHTPLNSATARPDDEVWFTMRQDVKVDGQVALFRGSPIRGSVTSVKPAIVNGRNQRTEIQIRLEEVPLAEGGSLAIAAQILKVQGETQQGSGILSPSTVGQAAQGAMLGGMISRTGKAAAIGAAAAVGVDMLGKVLQPKGPSSDVDLPKGSVFEAKLERALDIPNPTLLAKAPPQAPPPAVAASDSTLPVIESAAVYQPDPTTPDVGSRTIPESKESPQPSSVPTFDPVAPEPAAAGDASPSVASIEPSAVPSATKAGVATLRVDVNLVQVDTIVRDRAGKLMTNLRKEDFRVFEDGVEQQIQLFSRDELPLAVALVIDRSGSVAPMMSTIQNAAYQALQQLKAGDHVCLFTFAGSVELLEELTANKQRVANRIGSIRAGGGTNIVDALHEAMLYLDSAAPDRRHAVILISDNEEGRSQITADQAIELALETDTVIYSVKVDNNTASPFGLPRLPGLPLPRLPFPTRGSDPVQNIVKETGGELFDVASNGSIDNALMTAVARLKLRYTLSYAPQQPNPKTGYHRIEVRLVDRFGKPNLDYDVHARSGYYDPSTKQAGRTSAARP